MLHEEDPLSEIDSIQTCSCHRCVWGHPLNTCVKFSEKLTFRNVSFSEKFAHVLNGWPLSICFTRREILEVFCDSDHEILPNIYVQFDSNLITIQDKEYLLNTYQ